MWGVFLYMVLGITIVYIMHKEQPVTRLQAVVFFLICPLSWLIVIANYVAELPWAKKFADWLNSEMGS